LQHPPFERVLSFLARFLRSDLGIASHARSRRWQFVTLAT